MLSDETRETIYGNQTLSQYRRSLIGFCAALDDELTDQEWLELLYGILACADWDAIDRFCSEHSCFD